MGSAALDALGEVAQHSRTGNGRFFGYVMGSGEPVAALGDFFASVINQNATAWRSGPATAVIERTVVGWLAEALGCRGFSGTLTSGGSLANLMGLAMARESKAPANEAGVAGGVVYASSEVHMSVGKAVALLGLGRKHLRLLPTDKELRLDLAALRQAVSSDRAAGRTPIAVVASAGTIVTGAVDPIADIVEVAKAEDPWVHVDGAYGAPAAMVEPELFRGLSDVDSLSLDAHKWLYQPLDCSVLFYRDAAAARRTFSLTDDYAASLSQDPVEGMVFFEETVELSRRVRALKLWLWLRYHGLETFRESIAGNISQARRLAGLIDAEPDLERLAAVSLSRSASGGPAQTQPSWTRPTGRSLSGSTVGDGCTCPMPRCRGALCCARASPTTARSIPMSMRLSRRSAPPLRRPDTRHKRASGAGVEHHDALLDRKPRQAPIATSMPMTCAGTTRQTSELPTVGP